MTETKVVFIVIDPKEPDETANIIKVQVLSAGIAMVDALNEILKGYEVDMFKYDPELMPPPEALTYDMREKRSLQ